MYERFRKPESGSMAKEQTHRDIPSMILTVDQLSDELNITS